MLKTLGLAERVVVPTLDGDPIQAGIDLRIISGPPNISRERAEVSRGLGGHPLDPESVVSCAGSITARSRPRTRWCRVRPVS